MDRVGILRTIEMDWSESRVAQHDAGRVASGVIGVALSHDEDQSKSGVPARVGEVDVHSSGSASPDRYQPAQRSCFVDKDSI